MRALQTVVVKKFGRSCDQAVTAGTFRDYAKPVRGSAFEHGRAAVGLERQGDIASAERQVLKNSDLADSRRKSITLAHRSRSTLSNSLQRAAEHSQVDDVGAAHDENPLSEVGSTYEGTGIMSSTTRCKKLHLSHADIDDRVGSIIRRRKVSEIAVAAGRSDDAVKKWRLKLPEAWHAIINLIRHDDEIAAEVLALAGRAPAVTLGIRQRQALAEALRIIEGGRQ